MENYGRKQQRKDYTLVTNRRHPAPQSKIKPVDLAPPAASTNMSRRMVKRPSKKLLSIVVILIIGIIAALLINGRQTKSNSNHTGSSSGSISGANDGGPSSKPIANNTVLPKFSLYYPSSVPSGLSLDKSSVKYSDSLFTYSFSQNGKDLFFISEQPTLADFSYDKVKSKLQTPVELPTNLGTAVIGAANNNLITLINTAKKTTVIINCTATVCLVPSKQFISSMKLISSPVDILKK